MIMCDRATPTHPSSPLLLFIGLAEVREAGVNYPPEGAGAIDTAVAVVVAIVTLGKNNNFVILVLQRFG